MALGLFHTKHFKSSRNLRKLLISSPIPTSPAHSPISSSSPTFSLAGPLVVLKAKYGFTGVSFPEISVSEGDYCKLIERLDNGWLMVQCIDRAESGIVPALYVEIAVNDTENPISPEWLRDCKKRSTSIQDHPRSGTVSQVLLDSNGRFWYLYRVRMYSGKKVFLGKYYQDFYHLHWALQESLGSEVTLPSLPKPISVCGGEEKEFKLGKILKRCKELDDYQRSLLSIADVSRSLLMMNFVTENKNHRVVYERGESVPPTEEIIQMIYKDSNSIQSLLHVSTKSSFSTTEPLPLVDSFGNRLKYSAPEAFNHLNTKYLSYINQNPSTSSLRSQDNAKLSVNALGGQDGLALSKSSQTLSSFSSLIDKYDDMTDTSVDASFPHTMESDIRQGIAS